MTNLEGLGDHSLEWAWAYSKIQRAADRAAEVLPLIQQPSLAALKAENATLKAAAEALKAKPDPKPDPKLDDPDLQQKAKLGGGTPRIKTNAREKLARERAPIHDELDRLPEAE